MLLSHQILYPRNTNDLINFAESGKLTYLALELLLSALGSLGGCVTVVVSTTISGCTIISCDEYCVGSSVMVVSEISLGTLG